MGICICTWEDSCPCTLAEAMLDDELRWSRVGAFSRRVQSIPRAVGWPHLTAAAFGIEVDCGTAALLTTAAAAAAAAAAVAAAATDALLLDALFWPPCKTAHHFSFHTHFYLPTQNQNEPVASRNQSDLVMSDYDDEGKIVCQVGIKIHSRSKIKLNSLSVKSSSIVASFLTTV